MKISISEAQFSRPFAIRVPGARASVVAVRKRFRNCQREIEIPPIGSASFVGCDEYEFRFDRGRSFFSVRFAFRTKRNRLLRTTNYLMPLK